MIISAELSLYPLGINNFGLPVNTFIDELKKFNIEVQPGSMSTLVIGNSDEIFKAIHAAFEAVSHDTNVALITKISNACPI
jgi:uncharacterized protein YqgV (UPF0045/DUF77 family)